MNELHASAAPARQPAIILNQTVYLAKRRLALIAIWLPTLGTALALVLAVFQGVHAYQLALLGGMYVLTMMGVEVSFHRQLSHGAFGSPAWFRNMLAICGSMAMQGGPLYWVATHRRHHIHSDTPDDPHSPYFRLDRGGKAQALGWLRGLWHAQVSNMYTDYPTNVSAYSRDMLRDPAIMKINQRYPYWVALGLAIPAAIGAVAHPGWEGMLGGLLWGGLVRIFLVHHVYFANGSFSHMYGPRPFDNQDRSANNPVFGLPTFGSAYQNNHHAFPTSAWIGFDWWQPDVGHWFIVLFEKIGLAKDVRRATRAQINAKRRA